MDHNEVSGGAVHPDATKGMQGHINRNVRITSFYKDFKSPFLESTPQK
jgi:hypothetical protein